MGKLYVVRHADAGPRRGADGPDAGRELSGRGWRQAEGLRTQLAGVGAIRLIASPYVRCVQTLEPLAGHLGLTVEKDERLAERSGAADVLELAAEVRSSTAVLCSHGDVIPELLATLVASGTRLKDELRWQKASTWVLTWSGDHLAKGRYLPPPA